MNYRQDNYKNFRAAMEKTYMVDTRKTEGRRKRGFIVMRLGRSAEDGGPGCFVR